MNPLSKTWSMWIVRGIASILFGIIAVRWPAASVAALVLVYGAYALSEGALLIAFGLSHDGQRAPFVVRGLVSVAAGAVAFLHPGPTAVALYVLVGAWAITSGAAELGIALAARREGARVGTLVASGLLSLASGALLLALPAVGVVALLGFIAAYSVCNGVALISIGAGIHSLTRTQPAT